MTAVVEHPVDPHTDEPWWWACQHPERPPDPYVRWWWRCDGCMIAMHVAASVYCNMPVEEYREGTPERQGVDALNRMYAKSMDWRRSVGLPDPIGGM